MGSTNTGVLRIDERFTQCIEYMYAVLRIMLKGTQQLVLSPTLGARGEPLSARAHQIMPVWLELPEMPAWMADGCGCCRE